MTVPDSRFRTAASAGQAVAVIALLGWGFWQGVTALATPEAQSRIRDMLSWSA